MGKYPSQITVYRVLERNGTQSFQQYRTVSHVNIPPANKVVKTPIVIAIQKHISGLGEAQELRGSGIFPDKRNRRGSLVRRARGGGFTEQWCGVTRCCSYACY